MNQEAIAIKGLREMLASQDLLLLDEPPVLFHPARIVIMKTFYKHANVEFRDLQNNLQLTAGSLASHLRALKKNEYVREHKEIVGNRPRTTYEMTEKGRKAFGKFRRSLSLVLQDE